MDKDKFTKLQDCVANITQIMQQKACDKNDTKQVDTNNNIISDIQKVMADLDMMPGAYLDRSQMGWLCDMFDKCSAIVKDDTQYTVKCLCNVRYANNDTEIILYISDNVQGLGCDISYIRVRLNYDDKDTVYMLKSVRYDKYDISKRYFK